MATDDRKATLKHEPTKSGLDPFFLKFTASNGETLGVSETHPSLNAVADAREAWLRAMVEVLESEGYIIFPPKRVRE